jgi:hypothetical protein
MATASSTASSYFKSKHLLNLRIFEMKVDEDFVF